MSSLVAITAIFLGLSLFLYILFGGADFGAGILGCFLGKKEREAQEELILHAMAPVWEANHIWLILAVVILFMGFPPVYAALSTLLYVPLTALLIGIVLRGCAFTFRYYDVLGKPYFRTYSRVFGFASIWCAFFIGIIGGALILGRIGNSGTDYHSVFISPWLNPFCVSLGIFCIFLFTFVAAVFMVGEAQTKPLQKIFRRRAGFSNVGLIMAGELVFYFGEHEGLGLITAFFDHAISRWSFIIAALLWIPFWYFLVRAKKGHTVVVRAIGVAIVALVMLGWYEMQYPIILRLSGNPLTFQQMAAPEATLKALLFALIGGSVFIFPALIYLFKIFKWETLENK